METLKQYRDRKEAEYQEINKHKHNGYPTGIHCPDCGRELVHKDGMILLSLPPQKNIECNKCGFKTTIPV